MVRKTAFFLAVATLCGVLFGQDAAVATIATKEADYRLDGRSGGVLEVVRKADGAVVVVRVRNSYLVKSVNGDRTADESQDIVVSRECVPADGVSVKEMTFVCTNRALPGLRIAKRYFPINGGLGRKLSFVNDGGRMQFVLPYTECGFSGEFLKDAYYLGAGYVGPLMPAPKVARPSREDTFVQTSKGMALLNTAKPELGNFINMRVRIDGHPVLPWWQSTIGSYREDEDRLHYLPDGWRMCLGALDARPRDKIDYEDRLTFFSGGIFRLFDDIYGKDPAIAEIYATLGPDDPRVSDVFCTYGWGFEPYGRYLAQMTGRGQVFSTPMLSGEWGDYRWEEGFIGQSGGWIEGNDVRKFISGMKGISPRMLIGTYSILIAAGPRTRVFAEHPDWFRTCDRAGKRQSHFPGLVANYQAMVNKPACREFLARTVCENAVGMGADHVYVDEAQQENRINWQQEELVRDDNWIDLFGDLRRRAHDAGKILFFNGSGIPFADINYIERSPRQSNPDNWREFAGVVLGIEMLSRLRPDGRVVDINRTTDTVLAIPHCLSVGWIPAAQVVGGGSYLSHYRAVYETGKTLPIDARYSPDWKRDPLTQVESFAVRRRGAQDVLLSFINRQKGVVSIPVSVDLSSLGFAADDDVTVRAYKIWYPTSSEDVRQVLSERELVAEYAESGKNLDLVSDVRTVHVGKASGLLKHVFEDVTTNGVVQLVVTPGRATIASVAGLPSNYFYTKRKGVEIGEGRVTCEVSCEVIFVDQNGGCRLVQVKPGEHCLADLETDARPFTVRRQRPGRDSSVTFESFAYPGTPVFCKVDALGGRYISSYRNLRNLQTNLAPGVVGIDLTNRTLLAGTTLRNDTLDVNTYAGLRLKGAKTVRLELTNTFWNASSVNEAGRHTWGSGQPVRDFAGMVVDYGATGGGFSKRVDFSFGIGGSRMINALPPWGTGKKQDEHYSLGDLLSTPRTVFSLDLAKHAPTNWNGEAFLTLGQTHVLANRRMRLKVLATNDRAAADFLEGRKIVSGVFSGQMPEPIALPRRPAPIFGKDGFVGKESWGQLKGLQPFGSEDFYENTQAAIAYDGQSLLFDVFANETEKKALKVDDAVPYKNDCLEFHFRTLSGNYLQIIVDAAGRVMTLPDGVFPAEKIKVQTYAKTGKGWGICLQIPYDALKGFDGSLGTELRFNLCRSRRIRRGERSVWAPVRLGHGAFRDFEKFGVLTFGRLFKSMGRREEF